jgi:hypothetical protein
LRYQIAGCSASAPGLALILAAALKAAAALILVSACEVFQPGGESLKQFEQSTPADPVAADMIKPRTPEAAAALKQIGAKLEADRMNAKSYTGSDQQIGQYYSHKAAELQFLKNQLESNQAISKHQLSEALDNKGVLEYGGTP